VLLKRGQSSLLRLYRGSPGRVGPSQAIDIMNEGQINGTFLGLRIAFSYLK